MARSPRQLSLFEEDEPPDKADGRRLRQRLEAALGGRLTAFKLTNNRSRIIAAEPTPEGGLRVRLHRCFVHAADSLVTAIAEYILDRAKGARRKEIRRLVREHFLRYAAPAAKPRQPTLDPYGQHFDLVQIRDRLNARFFEGQLQVHITWGRSRRASRRRPARRRTLQLGSYQPETNVVRIHRVLDRRAVPAYVVQSVVYHEMLHAVLPPKRTKGGRRAIHPPEFRRRERLFPDLERAEKWIETHFNKLVRWRDKGAW